MSENSVQHFGMSRKIVSNMTSESWETIPHVCLTYKPEVSGMLAELKSINETLGDGKKITINTAILKIIVEGLKACPKLNGHISFDRRLVRGTVETMPNIDISMPFVFDSGEMMTLNIHGMEHKSMREIRDTIADTVARAKSSDLTEAMYEVSRDNTLAGLRKGKVGQALFRFAGVKLGSQRVKTLKGREKQTYYRRTSSERLTKRDLEQGTITVSNLGSIYKDWRGECTLLEIIPPQLVAIGLGAVQPQAVVDEDGIVRAGKVLPMTIAFDHRALDMGDVVPFMEALDSIFKAPEVLRNYV